MIASNPPAGKLIEVMSAQMNSADGTSDRALSIWTGEMSTPVTL